MKFAIVKEYRSSFGEQQPDVIAAVSETLGEAIAATVQVFIADHPEQAASIEDLSNSAAANHKLKGEEYILQIHDREQVIGYYGQDGRFSIENAGADNVLIRLLKWIPTETKTHTGATQMTNTTVKYTGLPEDFFFVLDDAPEEFPADEVDCAISRATATIALVSIALSHDDIRPHDFVLNNTLWGVSGQLELIKKLAAHYSCEAIYSAAKSAESVITMVMMDLRDQPEQPVDEILRNALDCVAVMLVKIKELSDQEHEQQRLLRAA